VKELDFTCLQIEQPHSGLQQTISWRFSKLNVKEDGISHKEQLKYSF